MARGLLLEEPSSSPAHAPARLPRQTLTMGVVHLDKWIEKIRRCEFLQEDELKALCEYVSW